MNYCISCRWVDQGEGQVQTNCFRVGCDLCWSCRLLNIPWLLQKVRAKVIQAASTEGQAKRGCMSKQLHLKIHIKENLCIRSNFLYILKFLKSGLQIEREGIAFEYQKDWGCSRKCKCRRVNVSLSFREEFIVHLLRGSLQDTSRRSSGVKGGMEMVEL